MEHNRAVVKITLLPLEQLAQPCFNQIEDIESPLDILVVEANKDVGELCDIHLFDVFFEIRLQRGQIQFKSIRSVSRFHRIIIFKRR